MPTAATHVAFRRLTHHRQHREPFDWLANDPGPPASLEIGEAIVYDGGMGEIHLSRVARDWHPADAVTFLVHVVPYFDIADADESFLYTCRTRFVRRCADVRATSG